MESSTGDLFTCRVKEILGKIPEGKVSTYGRIAMYAGNRSGARQVARILHSSSEKYRLPWQRVVNRNGEIPVRTSEGHIYQRLLLEQEGVVFDDNGRIDFDLFLWIPDYIPNEVLFTDWLEVQNKPLKNSREYT
jgi:methylated-DNA-protein-cysteine methyltransferase-like protein